MADRLNPPSRLSDLLVETSLSSPLQAPLIDLPAGVPGKLMITFAPGKNGSAALRPVMHRRDLNLDLKRLVELGTDTLVGFTEAREMEDISVPLEQLRTAAEAHGLTSLHHAIPDLKAPEGKAASDSALKFAQGLAERIRQGETVTVYCRGGLGRSGMMAAVVLVLLGEPADKAIQAVRRARGSRAIQTPMQEAFVNATARDLPVPAPKPVVASGRLRILLGLVAADALGAATEFQSPEQIARRFPDGLKTYASGSPFGFLPGESTDDSQMTIATLCGLTRGTKDTGEVLRHYLDWLAHRPPDVGNLTGSALRLAQRGAGQAAGMQAWVEGGMNNAGNGGLMRVAGVYLAGLSGPELTGIAVSVTALTHADPRCLIASVYMVKLLERLDLFGQPYQDAGPAAWIETEQALALVGSTLEAHGCFQGTSMTEQAYADLLVNAAPEVRKRVDSGLAGQRVSQTGYVLDTLQAALALQSGAGSWLEVAEAAALAGEDSDTVACVAGAIAGARGFEVPQSFLPELRVGASWGDWQRDWPSEHLDGLL